MNTRAKCAVMTVVAIGSLTAYLTNNDSSRIKEVAATATIVVARSWVLC